MTSPIAVAGNMDAPTLAAPIQPWRRCIERFVGRVAAAFIECGPAWLSAAGFAPPQNRVDDVPARIR